ncbi:hypothetical protein BJ973_004779 [Actinoplanes tereljensis]|uniref:hypothetical protein n=1 Tax=Paractinoplanes tereljensis TaxID=571912 RepID=UPI0019426C54|nr:hypothetical protein [Actinoplanes tereljensis]
MLHRDAALLGTHLHYVEAGSGSPAPSSMSATPVTFCPRAGRWKSRPGCRLG